MHGPVDDAPPPTPLALSRSRPISVFTSRSRGNPAGGYLLPWRRHDQPSTQKQKAGSWRVCALPSSMPCPLGRDPAQCPQQGPSLNSYRLWKVQDELACPGKYIVGFGGEGALTSDSASLAAPALLRPHTLFTEPQRSDAWCLAHPLAAIAPACDPASRKHSRKPQRSEPPLRNSTRYPESLPLWRSPTTPCPWVRARAR